MAVDASNSLLPVNGTLLLRASNASGWREEMVYFPNPGARAIAISMSVVHQHAGNEIQYYVT